MKRLRSSSALAAVGAVAARARADAALDPAKLLNPGTDSWPTYNGDYIRPALQHARPRSTTTT